VGRAHIAGQGRRRGARIVDYLRRRDEGAGQRDDRSDPARLPYGFAEGRGGRVPSYPVELPLPDVRTSLLQALA
jgi:hypothetical protein